MPSSSHHLSHTSLENQNSKKHLSQDIKQELNLPAGYRFLPTDVELLVPYLKNKNLGHPLPTNIIHDCDVYKYNPDDLERRYRVGQNNEMYFFTQRTRKSEFATRPNRRAGDGYWRATTACKKIHDQGKLLGYKMGLKFHKGKSGKGETTDWLMAEYRMDEVDPPTKTAASGGKRKRSTTNQDDQSMKMNGYVLVRIHRTGRGSNKDKQGQQMGDSYMGGIQLVTESTDQDDSFFADLDTILDTKLLDESSWEFMFGEVGELNNNSIGSDCGPLNNYGTIYSC